MPHIANHFATALLLLATVSHADDQPVSILAKRVSGHIHPSICKTNKGTLIVVFKTGQALSRSRSTDGGVTWEEPVLIETTSKRPDAIREVKKFEVYPGTTDALPDGRVLVTWNYIADDKATDGYYERALLYSLSSDDGKNWTDQSLIGPIDGKHLGAVRHNVLPSKSGHWILPLRVGVPRAFDPKTGNLLEFPVIGSDGKQHEFQQIIRTAKGSYLAMGPNLLRSTDRAATWSEIKDFPASAKSRDNLEGRHLTALSGGGVVVTWGVGHDNKGLRYNYSANDGQTWNSTINLMPETKIAARYYSGRTIQLDEKHIGTVFMNSNGVHFLKVAIERLSK